MQLMLSDLLPADTARVSAFVRLGSDRLRQAWSIGAEGNVQLVLYGGESPSTIPGTLDAAPILVRVVDAGTTHLDAGRTLVRPLQFDALIDVMVAVEAAMAPAGSAGGAATAASPSAAASAVAGAPQAAEPGLGTAAPPVSLDTTVRLKRWPPVALLGQWRYGVRMASCLSARFVSVRELAVLSNVPEDVCAEFVGILLARDLVRQPDPVKREPAAEARAEAAPVAAAPPAATAAPQASVRRGLFSRLRDKLGLGAIRSSA